MTLNHETIDLRYVEQLMDSEQLASLGNVVKHLEENVCDGSYLPGNLAMPRKQEIYACLNRYRRLGTSGK